MMTGFIRCLRKSVPNLFTLLNLLSGCFAILLSFYDPALAGLMILLAGVFDFCDGLAARLLDAYSDFGKELDSLADIVSFGVAPSFILFHLLTTYLLMKDPGFRMEQLTSPEILMLATSFLPALFAALRLARFNILNSKEASFSGLPSPAAGIFIASLGYILYTTDISWIQLVILNPGFLLAINALLCILMVSPLRMFTIKFSNFKLKDNKLRYFFILPSVVVLVYWGVKAVPLIIGWYILLSLSGEIISRVKPRQI